MRITGVSAYAMDLPLLLGTYTMSGGRSADSYATTVVRLTTDAGITGYGESCTGGSAYLDGFAGAVQAAVRELGPVLLGLDPLETALVDARLDAAMKGQMAAKSAIDVACWDIKGQALQVSIGTLLGGRFQESLPVFDAISLGTPKEMASRALAMRQEGYRNYQLKLGEDPVADSARVRAVVDAVGNWDLITCDANAALPRSQALRLANLLEEFDVFIEQPCKTLGDVANVRAHTNLPVVACEMVTSAEAVVEIAQLRAADAINLKLTRVGGITKAAQVRDLAQVLGLQLLVDSPGGGDLEAAAKLHLASSTDPKSLLAVSMTPVSVHIAGNTLPLVKEGRVSGLSRPGLGIDVEELMLGRPLFTITDD